MIWLSWRQFRAQAAVALLGLAGFAGWLVVLGLRIRRDAGLPMAQLEDRYQSVLYAADAVLLVLPAVIGLFWGAPLITRELEAGTHRLVWNQSVTRRRWLAVKLAVAALATAFTTGVASLLLTWAASPYDAVAGDRFSALLFGTRNLAPVGYAVFAVVLGAVTGTLVRRTVPAMALTAAVFVVVQALTPTLLRPHLLTPVTAARPVTAEVVRNLSFLGQEPEISGLRVPGAWVTATSRLRTADGRTVATDRYSRCVGGSIDDAPDCLARLGLHVDIAYQPAGRYWTFQWLESALFAVLAGILAAAGAHRVRRRLI